MSDSSFEISGKIIDIVGQRIINGTILVINGKVAGIREEKTANECYILPGLIDAHIHIESSMLIPSEFARLAVVHGTVATVSDPHEIGNVLGFKGVRFMIENGKKTPFKFFFGAPSCVPATTFETAGAVIGIDETDALLQSDDIHYLSEMMNFPGVLSNDPVVAKKLELAKKYGKPVDGHAPGLMGKQAEMYVHAGITTDHECFTLEEAVEKIRYGMKILIREGSAAKNFDALSGLIEEHTGMVMFCSDDKHPDDLVKGHINQLVKRAIAKGYDPLKVLRCCTLNPVRHYRLNVGLLQKDDPADFIVVDDLNHFRVLKTYIDGRLVAENGKNLIEPVIEEPVNNFNTGRISGSEIRVVPGNDLIKVMAALDGQLITEEISAKPRIENNNIISDPENDILKIIVKNRYADAPPAVGFVTGFSLKAGAMASSVSHDSHNIIAVGADDSSIIDAVNLIIDEKGGISFANQLERMILPLPVAGIMSPEDGYTVAEKYELLDKKAKEMGSPLKSPYMTLSFMALLVIPQLKLSDRGLFDGKNFSFTSLHKK